MSDLKPATPNPNIKLPPPISEGPAQAEPVVKALNQEEIDRETSLVRLNTEKLRLQREQLELEKLTDDIAKIRAQKAQSSMSAETVQESLDYSIADQKAHQNLCTHMKGGASEALLHNAPSQGTDSGNYAMIDHTLTTGVRFRMCQRCGKTWFPKDPDYRWAMTRPSKNSPSTGCPSPGLVRDRTKPVEKGGVRLTSEIPHDIAPPPDQPFGPTPTGY